MAVKPPIHEIICGKPGKGEDIGVSSVELLRMVIAAQI
jgi:hypothetical protein